VAKMRSHGRGAPAGRCARREAGEEIESGRLSRQVTCLVPDRTGRVVRNAASFPRYSLKAPRIHGAPSSTGMRLGSPPRRAREYPRRSFFFFFLSIACRRPGDRASSFPRNGAISTPTPTTSAAAAEAAGRVGCGGRGSREGKPAQKPGDFEFASQAARALRKEWRKIQIRIANRAVDLEGAITGEKNGPPNGCR